MSDAENTTERRPRPIHHHRIIELGDALSKNNTGVVALDGPGPGGASHRYRVHETETHADSPPLLEVSFQNGAVHEGNRGINGCFDEHLYAILIDRLQGFQRGEFATMEGKEALDHLIMSLDWLKVRTRDRAKRGVEGHHAK